MGVLTLLKEHNVLTFKELSCLLMIDIDDIEIQNRLDKLSEEGKISSYILNGIKFYKYKRRG